MLKMHDHLCQLSSFYKDEKTVAVVDPSRSGLLNDLFELKNGIQRQHRYLKLELENPLGERPNSHGIRLIIYQGKCITAACKVNGYIKTILCYTRNNKEAKYFSFIFTII